MANQRLSQILTFNKNITKAISNNSKESLGEYVQLSLFDYRPRKTVKIAAADELSFHSMQNFLNSGCIARIVDIRKYPDFFSVYNSMASALENFKEANICYYHFPIDIASHSNASARWRMRTKIHEALSCEVGTNEACLWLVQNARMKTEVIDEFSRLPELGNSWNIEIEPNF